MKKLTEIVEAVVLIAICYVAVFVLFYVNDAVMNWILEKVQ